MHIDDDVRECVRMPPRLIDFSVGKNVGFFSEQLATARYQRRVGNDIVIVIHNRSTPPPAEPSNVCWELRDQSAGT